MDLNTPVTAAAAAARLLDIVARLLRESQPAGGAVATPALDTPLEALGIDSLARVELLLRVERAFDVRLPEHLLAAAETPRDLLRAALAGTQDRQDFRQRGDDRIAEALAASAVAQPGPAGEASPGSAATLVEALDWHAERHPDRVHLVILGEGDEAESVTYGQLRTEARAVAAGLAQRGVGPGQAVAIMLPTGRAFFRAFAGIVLCGAVPVPIYPPMRWSQVEEHLRRQARILENCRAAALVTVDQAKLVASMLQGAVPTLEHVVTVEDLARDDAGARLPQPHAGDLAMLQYTSGSTGDPKGVMLTHANLLANIRAMGQAVRAGPGDVFVSWLPLYHDMGLIGAWMGGLYFAFPLVVMPPTAFLNRPSRWLHAIHRYRGTLSSAPNFAYEICARRVDERDLEGLDLSSWRIAFNGAEPVSPGTLERFAERYARYGFRREALAPVYGLAECCVGLAFPPLGRGPLVDRVEREALGGSGRAIPAAQEGPGVLHFVACGSPLPGHEIRIVGPEGRELPERIEGRVEFRGPSATGGYFKNAAKTRDLFDGEWLDTGDLGYLAGGEIFITGRAKDLIIRGGQHVHPYEVEDAVGNIPGVRKGCVAVFGVPDAVTGTEKVVVLAETRLPPGDGRDALRATVAETARATLGAPADDIVIASPHTVLKTSSGKIRRAACREAYMHGATGATRPAAWKAGATFVGSLIAARARRTARLAGQLAYGAWTWIAGGLLGLAALVAACVLPARLRYAALQALARALLRVSWLRVAVQGLEHIPPTGPLVLVANHASYVDGPLLFALLSRPVAFVAKRELAGNPVLRLILRACNVKFIERFDVERGAADLRSLVERVNGGEAVGFFAEGTFTRAPGLRPFHMGAFVLAAETGAPVVSVALRGTRSILREGQWMPHRGSVRLHIDPARRAAGRDWGDAARLRDEVRMEILAACGEPDLA